MEKTQSIDYRSISHLMDLSVSSIPFLGTYNLFFLLFFAYYYTRLVHVVKLHDRSFFSFPPARARALASLATFDYNRNLHIGSDSCSTVCLNMFVREKKSIDLISDEIARKIDRNGQVKKENRLAVFSSSRIYTTANQHLLGPKMVNS